MKFTFEYEFKKALDSFENRNYQLAKELIEPILKNQPKNHNALHLMGLIMGSENFHSNALIYFNKALKIDPKNYFLNLNTANAYAENGEISKAIKYVLIAIELDPNLKNAYIHYSKCLHKLKKFEEALIHCENAIMRDNNCSESWNNKAVICNDLLRFEEAITCCDNALYIKPDYVEAYLHKGNALFFLKQYEDALACFDKVIFLKPETIVAYGNKALTLSELKRLDEAIIFYEKALHLMPNIDWIYGDLIASKMRVCDWSNYDIQIEKLKKRINFDEKVIVPFPLLSLIDDPLLHKKNAEIYYKNKHPVIHELGNILKRPKKKKIRIGYFSPDFGNHAVSLLTAELFEIHNRELFEVIAICLDEKSSADVMRIRLKKAFDKFIETKNLNDCEIAKLSRELEIDIAIDLAGFTKNSRTGIFSYRAAPIQISYIGYLGTMGACYYDYLVADKTIIPTSLQQFYSEKIIYLPHYQVNDRKKLKSKRQFSRTELGIPENFVSFCCLNNSYKITPNIFKNWMAILKAVPKSVLYLYKENKFCEINLKNEAEKNGINYERLIFGEKLSVSDNLARYQAFDLFLDTYPYNAGTTASDALWAGLPVLTLMGQSFPSRVAASILNAVGLSELITNTQEEYIFLAVELANSPKKLYEIKEKLKENKNLFPLFNTPLFTKKLEAAYTEIYDKYHRDFQPDHIVIDDNVHPA